MNCNDWIEKELHGLQAISQNCTKLSELNLTCLHIHAVSGGGSGKHVNRMCTIISEMHNLNSLGENSRLDSCIVFVLN